jgi:hypothetical protein
VAAGAEEATGGGGGVVLGEPAGHDPDLVVEAVAAHGLAVAAAMVGTGGAAPVDVRDAAVAETHEVVDGLVQSLVVGGADDVEVPVAGRARHDDHG